MQDAMDFDKFITCNQESSPEYGIVFGNGNKNVLLVKAGQGGSARGYKDKYLKLAHEIRNAYGMSVVCSSTPDTEINQMEHAMQALEKEDLLTADTRIYFVGFSKGASIGCLQGTAFPQIVRYLLVNPPMMINLPKTCRIAKKLQRRKNDIRRRKRRSFRKFGRPAASPRTREHDRPHHPRAGPLPVAGQL